MLKSTEINFLCVHKKLRGLRLAPVLIAEITRRCNIFGIYQAIYTAGIVLPKPVSSCRYMHRPLNWLKLYDVGFSAMPPHSNKNRQVTRNFLPSATSSVGLRPAQQKDVGAITDLLGRYLENFAMAVEFTEEEVEHWFLHNEVTAPEQVIWSYVVEDPKSHKITDFFSFYVLESAVIGNPKHQMVRAAYLFYYATEAAFQKEEKVLKERLNLLINDALILAKRVGDVPVSPCYITDLSWQFGFDVFNALTLLDNPLFLESQKFGLGDGQLHFYLYNYRTMPIPGGVDSKNNVDPKRRGGVGVVML